MHFSPSALFPLSLFLSLLTGVEMGWDGGGGVGVGDLWRFLSETVRRFQ